MAGDSDIIAGFSSRGPGDFFYNIKPDVVAPGVNIYSSVFDNEFAMFQGTSMASPHAAGSAALLLDALGDDLTPADVKSLLGNNADRDLWETVVGGDTVGVLERGGGRINVDRALDAEGVVYCYPQTAARPRGCYARHRPSETVKGRHALFELR